MRKIWIMSDALFTLCLYKCILFKRHFIYLYVNTVHFGRATFPACYVLVVEKISGYYRARPRAIRSNQPLCFARFFVADKQRIFCIFDSPRREQCTQRLTAYIASDVRLSESLCKHAIHAV